jgi:serine protease
LGKCGGYDSDIIAGMMWAGGLSDDVGLGRARLSYPNPYPARVLNLSLGTQGNCSRAYTDVIEQLSQRGVTVVAAAGNDTGFPVATPANCPGVIAVAGLRHIGTKVGYSNIGPEVSLAAPAGNCVNLTGPCLYPLVTTTNAGRNSPTANTYSDAENASVGTSFAAPLVAATAALMIAANEGLSPVDIKSILKRTARPFPRTGAEQGVRVCNEPSSTEQLECYCTTSTCGAGFLNSFDAVSLAADLAATQLSYRTNIDIYNAETNRLQMAKVHVGELSYFNVSVSVDRVIALGEQSAGVDHATRYDAVSGLLSIAEVMVGKARYRHVTVTIREVLQIGVP